MLTYMKSKDEYKNNYLLVIYVLIYFNNTSVLRTVRQL